MAPIPQASSRKHAQTCIYMNTIIVHCILHVNLFTMHCPKHQTNNPKAQTCQRAHIRTNATHGCSVPYLNTQDDKSSGEPMYLYSYPSPETMILPGLAPRSSGKNRQRSISSKRTVLQLLPCRLNPEHSNTKANYLNIKPLPCTLKLVYL